MNARDLASRLGLKPDGREWRGTCPACGYGSNSFVLKVGDGGRPIWWCASCRDGAAIAKAIGIGRPGRQGSHGTNGTTNRGSNNQDRAISLWDSAQPAAGTPADAYLTSRGLCGLAASPALRFRGRCPHPSKVWLPAMIAAITSVDGEPVAAHRTFLNANGSGKADVEPARASLGPLWGGAVRLHAEDPDRPLVVGEGIETTASAGLLMGFPSWAALSAGNLAKGLALPPEVRRVIIAADPDEPGQNAARDAWIRWRDEGREVQIATPNGTGDFNDLITNKEYAHG